MSFHSAILYFLLHCAFTLSSTDAQPAEPHTNPADRIDIPYHELPIHTTRAHTGHRTWCTVDGKNGRTDWLLELLRDPPIVVWVKKANRDRSLTKGCGENRSATKSK